MCGCLNYGCVTVDMEGNNRNVISGFSTVLMGRNPNPQADQGLTVYLSTLKKEK